MQTAAQELGVGLSVLKRICRQLGLARWPFRTRQSLRGVIAKTEQYLVRANVHTSPLVVQNDGLFLQRTLPGSHCKHATYLESSAPSHFRDSVSKSGFSSSVRAK